MSLNIVFFYPNASRYVGTPLGVSSLSSIVQERGHSCSIFDATFYDDALLGNEFVQYIRNNRCDVLLVHCTSTDWWLVKLLLNYIYYELGANDRPLTIVGGQHPTIVPEEVLNEPGIDIIVLGEGELVLREILDCIHQGNDLSPIRNCWVKNNNHKVRNSVRELVDDLDSLPYPKWDLFDGKHRKQYAQDGIDTGVRPINIETSRGCPYSCTFCMNSHYRNLYRGLGTYCRAKSARRIVSETCLAKETLGINYIQFVDDNFLVFRERLEELATLYPAEVGLPFSVQASADKIDESSVSQLKNMGADMLALGVESGNESYRAKILGKKVTDKQILNAINLAKENDIGTMAYYMVGLPFETSEDIEKTIAFNNLAQPDICIVSSFFPFPGTPLYREAIDKQLISETDFGDFFHVSMWRQDELSEDRFGELRRRFGKTVTFFGPLKPRNRKRVQASLIKHTEEEIQR